MNSLLLWLSPVVLLLLFWGLPADPVDDMGSDELDDHGDESPKEDDIVDIPAENSVPIEYQHHWERRHRNRRII